MIHGKIKQNAKDPLSLKNKLQQFGVF